jgi:hypothetical protein
MRDEKVISYTAIKTEIIPNTAKWKHRVMVGTPVTGMVRVEWVQGRYSQAIPTNWSTMEIYQWCSSVMPLQYQVSDAQNLIVKSCIEQEAEWLFFVEHDNVLPPNTFMKLNDYMRDRKIPVVSGLYFTKSIPPEPMIYRDMGWSYYQDWKLGDKVWCRGVPTGCLLIHSSILRAMWNESPDYKLGDLTTRRVFQEPSRVYFDPEKHAYQSESGTSDLAWCKRVIDEKFFEKAGWKIYQEKEFPFLVDTSLFVRHIDDQGRQWPLEIPAKYLHEDRSRHRPQRNLAGK